MATRSAIAELPVYVSGPGTVARCPGCASVAIVLARGTARFSGYQLGGREIGGIDSMRCTHLDQVVLTRLANPIEAAWNACSRWPVSASAKSARVRGVRMIHQYLRSL